MFKKLKEKIVNNKLKFCISLLAFAIIFSGIVVTINNTKVTYADSASDYFCPIGGKIYYGPISTDSGGYYCNLGDKVLVASFSYKDDSSIASDSDCSAYLLEKGYREAIGGSYCSYEAVKNVGTVNCMAGEYYLGQGKCVPCVASYYCPGGTFNTGNSSRSGIYECPSGTTSDFGSSSCTSIDDGSTDTPSITISFDTVGGDTIDDIKLTENEAITLPSAIKSGYKFLYWKDENERKYNTSATYTFKSNTILTAEWGINITLEPNGGSLYWCEEFDDNGLCLEYFSYNEAKTYTATLEGLKLDNKEVFDINKTGYTLLGWSTKEEATTKEYNENYIAKSSMKLYAVWRSDNITFNNAEGDEVVKSCDLDENDKISSSCVSAVKKICKKWSPDKCAEGNCISSTQSNHIPIEDFSDMTFTTTITNYYCVAGSSVHESTTPSTPEPEEPKEACYECSTDSNIMKWKTNGEGDSECAAGYNKTDKLKSECKPVVPEEPKEACYECSTDSNIMKWKTNGEGDSECTAGYVKNDKLVSECKPVVPEDDDIKDNSPTGDIMIALVWLVGLGALGYSLYYFRTRKINI